MTSSIRSVAAALAIGIFGTASSAQDYRLIKSAQIQAE
jgi:hypothetical protein